MLSNYVKILFFIQLFTYWFQHPLTNPEVHQSFSAHCCCLVAKSCATLCDPMDCSLPGSSVHWIPQERILIWGILRIFLPPSLVYSFSYLYPYPFGLMDFFFYLVGYNPLLSLCILMNTFQIQSARALSSRVLFLLNLLPYFFEHLLSSMQDPSCLS